MSMVKSELGIVINYCTNDYRFSNVCIENALNISSNVIVSVSDSFFSGDLENQHLLNKTYKENPRAKFIQFNYNLALTKRLAIRFWHNMSRWIGFHFLPDTVTHVLFLDVDEVLDSEAFKLWLSTVYITDYDAYRFGCYWYFRDPKYQATTFEMAPVLVKKELISPTSIFSNFEREGLLFKNYALDILSNNHKPMVHHYSWVRTKQEMIKKVLSWGHINDRDWVSEINQEFSHDFNGKDFVHGYEYKCVDPFFKIEPPMTQELENKHEPKTDSPNVTYLHPQLFNCLLQTSGLSYKGLLKVLYRYLRYK